MSFLTKKINSEVFNLAVGIILILFGAYILYFTKPDPLRGMVRIFMEIVPFVLMVFFGLLLSIKVIRNLKRQKNSLQNINNDQLNTTTKVVGIMTGIGFYLFLIPIIFVITLFFLWYFSS